MSVQGFYRGSVLCGASVLRAHLTDLAHPSSRCLGKKQVPTANHTQHQPSALTATAWPQAPGARTPHDRTFHAASRRPVPDTRLFWECAGSGHPRPAECFPGGGGRKVSRTQKAERAGAETVRPFCMSRAPGTMWTRNMEDWTEGCRRSPGGFRPQAARGLRQQVGDRRLSLHGLVAS